MKKLISLVLAVAMVAGMMGIAFAADEDPTYSITVTNTNETISISGHTYTAYKLFDMTYSGENYAYSIDSDGDGSWAWDTIKGTADEDGVYTNSTYGLVFTPSASDATVYYITSSSTMTPEQARALADDLESHRPSTNNGTATVAENAQTCTINTTPNAAGYYLVYGTAEAKDPETQDGDIVAAVALDSTDPSMTVNPKASIPTLDKKITGVFTMEEGAVTENPDGSVMANGQAAVAKVGAAVAYELDAVTPDLTGYDDYTYIIGDSISTGLDYIKDSFVLEIGGTEVDFVTTATTEEGQDTDNELIFANDNKSFALTIPFKVLEQYDAGTAVVLTYKCSVNNSALTYDYENNTANLEYSRTPYDDDTNHTPDKKTFVIDINLDVDKVAESASGEKLTGAKFKLFKGTNRTGNVFYHYDETNGVTWVAEDDGDVFETKNGALDPQVRGLDVGTYSFLEIEAPTGYNLLDAPVVVELTPAETTDNGVVKSVTYTATYGGQNAAMTNGTVNLASDSHTEKQPVATGTIVNNGGVKLPSTGGIGTTLFYIVGAALVLGAGILLVTKRKMAVK